MLIFLSAFCFFDLSLVFLCGTNVYNPLPRRNIIDERRERWKHGGGFGTNVLHVPGDVSGQSRRHQAADSRPRPAAVPSFLRAEGTGAGGESVLQQIPGQDPETAQVSGLISETSPEKSVI